MDVGGGAMHGAIAEAQRETFIADKASICMRINPHLQKTCITLDKNHCASAPLQ